MIVILVVIDQIIKWAVVQWKPCFNLLGDILKIDYSENTGTIFGMFEGKNMEFMIIAAVLCVMLALFMRKFVPRRTFKEKCYMLILSGGIGNLIDRIVRGFVIDYVSLKWIGVFNLSDIYIVIGFILVVILEMRDIWTDGSEKKKDFYRD